MRAEWKCPKCGAGAGDHGRGECVTDRGMGCEGLICECDDHGSKDHGEHPNNPCPNANCYHCGWGGTLPVPEYKFKGWAKKAWEAGWRPPADWEPPPEVVAK